jgi:hypothetical protein
LRCENWAELAFPWHCQLNWDCSKLSTVIPELAGALRLCSQIQPSNFSPIFKALAQLFAIAFGSQLMCFRVEVVVTIKKLKEIVALALGI